MSEASESHAAEVDPSVLGWAENAIGGRLLAYLLGCDVSDLPPLISGETTPTKQQLDVVTSFSNLRKHIPAELDDVTSKGAVRNFLMQVTPDGRSVARSMREHVIGPEAVPDGNDAIEQSFLVLAVDAYPICLLPPDPALPRGIHDFSPRTTALLFRHPQSKAFSDAALRDTTLKSVFKDEEEGIGRVANISRNIGSSGWLQLMMLTELLLQSAWRKLPPDEFTLDSFVMTALEQLRLVRDAFAGKPCTITAKLAFTGILLPPGRALALSNGRVRAVNEAERRFVPESLKGQLGGSEASGVTTTINYDGDVVLEYDFPYKVQRQPLREEPPSPWPIELRPPLAMEQAMMRLRYSLMLAVKRDHRVQLVQTWRAFDEPLSHNIVMSWSDPRQGAGIMPTQLTDAEAEAWGEWYERLNAPHMAKIDLALTRILRAIAERREPSDVLIDSVIAWENLFGTKEGEPTFRVTMCLAKLLEQTVEARLTLRTKLAKIYALRSKIVHGGGTLKETEYSLCNDALDTAIKAVEVLLTDRADILKLPDGAQRSAALLLGP